MAERDGPEQQPSLSEQIKELRPGLKALTALGEEFRSSMEHLVAVIAFASHPDLTGLDDELDTLYRGQI